MRNGNCNHLFLPNQLRKYAATSTYIAKVDEIQNCQIAKHLDFCFWEGPGTPVRNARCFCSQWSRGKADNSDQFPFFLMPDHNKKETSKEAKASTRNYTGIDTR